jgi:hypothetical protein
VSWFAIVEPEPPERQRNTEQLLSGTPMPWPAVVILEVSSHTMLFRYALDGSFGGDTWHGSEAEARDQAEWEYEGLVGEWIQIPDGHENIEFALAHARSAPGA